MFIKQRLDLLTARAWLEDNATLKQEVVRLSMASGVPVPQHTSMVGFETTKCVHLWTGFMGGHCTGGLLRHSDVRNGPTASVLGASYGQLCDKE